MAKVKQGKKNIQNPVGAKARGAASEEKFVFPLERDNFLILGLGVVLIIAGYIFMAIPDHPDDFMTLTLAPILLVLGFIVVIPLGLMYRRKNSTANTKK